MLKAFAQLGFGSLDRATKDLTEEQLDWKSYPEANTIRGNLTHLASKMFVFVLKIIKGDKDYKPEGGPDDYVGNESYSLEKIIGDIMKGKTKFLKKLGNLTARAETPPGRRPHWFAAELIQAINERYGAVSCAEVLGLDLRDPVDLETYNGLDHWNTRPAAN